GYATAPDYAQRLIRIIEDNELYLLDRPNGNRLYASHKGGESGKSHVRSHVRRATSGTSVDPDDYQVTINAHNGYKVYSANGVHYVLAKSGDTFETIGAQFRVSARNLRKFNDLKESDAQPLAGMPVYIERKKRRWTGNTGIHICRAGETIHTLGQVYAVRSRSIEKMNRLRPDAILAEGQELRLN
ncbi:MAG: LysM peptidoglycan-binding domain-containing protein, partial [Alistipes sp.]|nr:LysM peptidoglycan-binding domain-containing protein [Alistipes sp.]